MWNKNRWLMIKTNGWNLLRFYPNLNTYHFQALKIQEYFPTSSIFRLWVFRFLWIFESPRLPAPNHGWKSLSRKWFQFSYPVAHLVHLRTYKRPHCSKMKCFHVALMYPFHKQIDPLDSCNQHPFARLKIIKMGFSYKRQICFTYFVIANGGTSFAATCYRVHFSTPKASFSQFSNRAS